MRRRNRFFVVACLVLTACNSQLKSRVEEEQSIMQTDLEMSAMAEQEGFHAALLHYAAEDFVKLDDGALPAQGKAAYQQRTEGRTGPKTLTWKPEKAEVARSGELGYTWGNWKFVLPDTTMYGNYFSVWRKDVAGNWKLALDGGNTTPPPHEI